MVKISWKHVSVSSWPMLFLCISGSVAEEAEWNWEHIILYLLLHCFHSAILCPGLGCHLQYFKLILRAINHWHIPSLPKITHHMIWIIFIIMIHYICIFQRMKLKYLILTMRSMISTKPILRCSGSDTLKYYSIIILS